MKYTPFPLFQYMLQFQAFVLLFILQRARGSVLPLSDEGLTLETVSFINQACYPWAIRTKECFGTAASGRYTLSRVI